MRRVTLGQQYLDVVTVEGLEVADCVGVRSVEFDRDLDSDSVLLAQVGQHGRPCLTGLWPVGSDHCHPDEASVGPVAAESRRPDFDGHGRNRRRVDANVDRRQFPIAMGAQLLFERERRTRGNHRDPLQGIQTSLFRRKVGIVSFSSSAYHDSNEFTAASGGRGQPEGQPSWLRSVVK